MDYHDWAYYTWFVPRASLGTNIHSTMRHKTISSSNTPTHITHGILKQDVLRHGQSWNQPWLACQYRSGYHVRAGARSPGEAHSSARSSGTLLENYKESHLSSPSVGHQPTIPSFASVDWLNLTFSRFSIFISLRAELSSIQVLLFDR